MQYIVRAPEDIFWGVMMLKRDFPVYCSSFLTTDFERELNLQGIKYTKTLEGLFWKYKKRREADERS